MRGRRKRCERYEVAEKICCLWWDDMLIWNSFCILLSLSLTPRQNVWKLNSKIIKTEEFSNEKLDFYSEEWI